jgi:hypothetical protein
MKTGPLAVATAKQEVVNLLIDEIGVALEVLLVDVEPGGNPEESLEFRHAYNVAGGALVPIRRRRSSLLHPRHHVAAREPGSH